MTTILYGVAVVGMMLLPLALLCGIVAIIIALLRERRQPDGES